MGYPMSYQRALDRQQLHGDYGAPYPDPEHVGHDPDHTGYPGKCICGLQSHWVSNQIAGDLRRVETDQRDPAHLKAYARIAGITSQQAKAVLDAFFGSPYDHPEFGEEMMFAWCEEDPSRWETQLGREMAERRKEIYGA